MKNWVGVGLSLILLAGLFLFIAPQIERAVSLHMLASIAPWAVVAGVFFFWLNFAVSTERYRLILRNIAAYTPGFWPLYRLTFLSFFLAHFVAVGPAADVVRVGYGRFRLGLSTKVAIESVVYDRVWALVGIAALGLMSMPLQVARGVPDVLLLSQLALWLASLVGVFLITWGACAQIIQRIPFLAVIARSVNGFLPAIVGKEGLFLQIALAFGYSITYGLVMWVLALGMGLDIGVLDVLQFSPLILLAQNLPFFYVGWGVRETVVIGTLGLSGAMSSEQALAVSVATGTVFFLASVPGAIVWLFQPPKAPSTTDVV